MRMLDLFCGRFGWGRAFAVRGWEVIGIDLTMPPPEAIPEGATVIERDILTIDAEWIKRNAFDFICASSPCEQFSVHGMKHFHPNPPHPEIGLVLFNHTRAICEASGLAFVMENVRAAEGFLGTAHQHCGPFYLWGNAVPPLMPQGVKKGISMGGGKFKDIPPGPQRRELRKGIPFMQSSSHSNERKALTAAAATIPPELASCVADYAERILADAPAE